MCSPPLTTISNLSVSQAHSACHDNIPKRPQQESGYTTTMIMTPTLKRRQKRVSFSQTCSVQFVEPRSSFSTSERDAYWYKSAEIKAFHTVARETCRKLRTYSTATAPVACRGLELRTSVARQKRKLLTLQCVLMAQRRLRDPRLIAQMAARCSHWAAKAAHAEAQRDLIRAYADDRCEAFLPPLPSMAGYPLPLKGVAKKRTMPDNASNDVERCVRRRISVC